MPKKISEERRAQMREVMAKNRAKKSDDIVLTDPQKQAFLHNYYSPESDTYANAYQSAVAAGYSKSYAKIITSPGAGNKWINISNYMDSTNMTPQHIIKSFERVALRGNKTADQLKALEFLAKINGMLVEKKITATMNIDNFLEDAEKTVKDADIIDI